MRRLTVLTRCGMLEVPIRMYRKGLQKVSDVEQLAVPQPVWVQYSQTVWTMWYNGHLNDLVMRPNGVVWYYDGEQEGVFETLEEAFDAAESDLYFKEQERG